MAAGVLNQTPLDWAANVEHVLGAIEAARSSSDQTPWLYEALQLEGDILVARAGQHRGRGDLERAREDLLSAGRAYARGLEVARSDAWLYAAEPRRLLRLIELAEAADGDLGFTSLEEIRREISRVVP